MNMPIDERRQIENEMIFRRGNESVGIKLDEIDAMHKEDGHPHLVNDEDMTLQFKCECSDENCSERIQMKLSTYRFIHMNRDTFVIRRNHQVQAIEKVIIKEKDYYVVRKNHSTSEPEGTLHSTAIQNG